MPRNHVLIVSLIVVALAACGSSSKSSGPTANVTAPSTTTTSATDAPTTTTPAVIDACKLVTKAQAEAAIGTKLTDPLQVSNSDVDSCTYPGDPTGPTAQVEVFVGAGAKKYYDDDNTVLHHTFTAVPGLGDESHEEDYAVFFRKGSTWVCAPTHESRRLLDVQASTRSSGQDRRRPDLIGAIDGCEPGTNASIVDRRGHGRGVGRRRVQRGWIVEEFRERGIDRPHRRRGQERGADLRLRPRSPRPGSTTSLMS